MKKDTKHIRAEIVNKSLAYINKYIDSNITLDELARLNSVSKYHFHRIFKEETNENVFYRISTIRLQKAAHLLITNKYSTISEILQLCGYSSHSSFIKAFKNRFTFTPSQWKNGGYISYSKKHLSLNENLNDYFLEHEVIIKVVPKITCAYIRHKGYDLSLNKTWARLLAYAYEKNLNTITQIGIFYDNPIFIANQDCHYMAAIQIDSNFISSNSISELQIEESLCAVFKQKGVYGDVVKLISYIYNYWLPNSGYEAKRQTSYAIYHKNHFLEENDNFSLDFYVPIQVV